MIGTFQGIMYELPPFEKYLTQIFQNESMYVVGECQINVLTFSILINELYLPEYYTKKDTYSMIG